MNIRPPGRRMLISYVALYMTFAGTAARALFALRDDPGYRYMLGVLALYLLLLLISPKLIARSLSYLHVINVLLTAMALVLLLFMGEFDSFAMLFIAPCAFSVLYFPQRTALAWIVGITVLMEAALFMKFPADELLSYAIIYPAAILLVIGLVYLARQAEEAQVRSENLLADLEQANQKLQAYALQVEEMAAANERNRLARELHDSVTQTIFGLTLTAQAARILLERDPERAAGQLDHIQVLAKNALSEMRALIQQLHPRSIDDEGLIPSLRRLVVERQANHGLKIDLKISGERRLPAHIENELFNIAKEGLSNIIKHAQTDQAALTLFLEDGNRVSMCIEDAGIGFDSTRMKPSPGHLGLTSMSERVQALGGSLTIETQPGKGTRVQVELVLPQEVANA
jgi:signal transduction histidine kinase